MPKEPNVLTAAEAARRKNCTAQTIYNAIERGDLNAVQMGGSRLVYRDEAFERYEVKETGGRMHDSYQREQTSK